MIASFGDDATDDLFSQENTARVRRWGADVQRMARRKLYAIEAASLLKDLRVPPGNRLEALHGGYAGYHSIRINDQWRIVFKWKDGVAHEVRVTDYH